MESLQTPKPHAVCVPFPAQGHVNPFMQLAKLLRCMGFHITFVNTEFNHKRLVKSLGPDFVKGLQDFRFETIPDGLPASDKDATQDVPPLCDATRKNCYAPFKELVKKLNSSPEVPSVSCIIADGIMGFAGRVAKHLGIPELQFWTASGCGFVGYLQYDELVRRGILPFKDLMGILTGVSKEKEYYRNSEKSKMIVIELDNDGYRFKVTLFGDEVDQLNTFVASGDATNAVIVILFAKVKKWQGINSISNNYSTKLLFNPQIPEVQNFKSKMIVRLDTPVKGLSQLQEKTKLSLSDDLLKMTPKATIKHMKDSYLKDKGISGSEPSYFVVLATITEMVDEDMWYYTACSRCTRKATPDSGMYYCGKCKKHIIDVTPSFFLRLRVKDDNSVATFVMFNRDAAEFLKKSCVDMLMEYNMNNESGSLPKELSVLEDKTVLFKVGCDRGSGSRYEPSYIVKRVTDDSDIIQQFINQGNVNPSDEITADLTPQNLQAKSIETEDVAQDLAARFEDTRSDGRVETPDIENNLHDGKVETQDRDVVDLSSDTPVGSDMKRSYPIGENSASLENLKKNIKIEKE